MLVLLRRGVIWSHQSLRLLLDALLAQDFPQKATNEPVPSGRGDKVKLCHMVYNIRARLVFSSLDHSHLLSLTCKYESAYVNTELSSLPSKKISYEKQVPGMKYKVAMEPYCKAPNLISNKAVFRGQSL